MYIGLFSCFLVSFHVCTSLLMFVGPFSCVWVFFVGVVASIQSVK